jgi:hypothetical protein
MLLSAIALLSTFGFGSNTEGYCLPPLPPTAQPRQIGWYSYLERKGVCEQHSCS